MDNISSLLIKEKKDNVFKLIKNMIFESDIKKVLYKI